MEPIISSASTASTTSTRSKWTVKGRTGRTFLAATSAAVLATVLGACGSAGGGNTSEPSAAPTEAATLSNLVPEEIREAGVLQYGGGFTYVPFNFKSESGDDWEGGEAEIIKKVGELLGLEIVFTDIAFSTVLTALEQGRFDVAGGGIQVSDERRNVVDFAVYGVTGTSLVARAGNPADISSDDMCGHIVAVGTGSIQVEQVARASEEECVAKGKPAIEVQAQQNLASSLQAVQTGRAEAYASGVASSATNVQSSGGALEAIEGIVPNTETSLGFLFDPRNVDLAQAFTAALEELEQSGELERINDTWSIASDIGVEYLPSTGS